MRIGAIVMLVGASLAARAPQPVSAETTPPAAQVVDGGEPVPGSELRVWLMTIGPGDAVWERFGHNAIRVLDTRTGRDVSYNWGIFDFQQVDFIPRFLKGQMLYMMAPFSTAGMVQAYARTGREVVLQELAMTPAQRLELRSLAEENALPENRDYRYHYFLDNCSTRVRDLLDRVLGGALSARFMDQPTGTSFRFHTRRLTKIDPLIYTGMDFLLGSPGDAPISTWQEMFLPMTLRDALRDVTVPGPDGSGTPLVVAEEVTVAAPGRTEPAGPPSWFAIYLGIGLALGAVALWGLARSGTSRAAAVVGGLVGGLWGLVAGVLGTLLVLVLFTDHDFMAWNENLFLVNPLALALFALVPLAVRSARWRTSAVRIAGAVLTIACVGLVLQVTPFVDQQNAIMYALALPLHFGVWLGLRRVGDAAPAV